MSAFVVDTNVPVVANGRTPQAGPDCVTACVDALKAVIDGEGIVLDDAMLILTEYRGKLSMSGQGGPGNAFMKWVFDNQAVIQRCEQVHITAKGLNVRDDFEEFPTDCALATFDRSDRKFVAVALTSKRNPEVLNAVDSDWWKYRAVLNKHGVRIRFVCPGQFLTQL